MLAVYGRPEEMAKLAGKKEGNGEKVTVECLLKPLKQLRSRHDLKPETMWTCRPRQLRAGEGSGNFAE